MHMKEVPNGNGSGNSFVGGGDQSFNDDQSTSDYDDVLEFSSEGEGAANDFSDFLWMENEDQFETEVFASLEEQELINQCNEDLGEIALLDEIREIRDEIEAEQHVNDVYVDVAQNSKLNPNAVPFKLNNDFHFIELSSN